MTNRVGQRFGNYRLVRLLGHGGFAEVYLGKHVRLGTHTAIKILHTSLEDNDVEGFLHEAQTVAHLRHPNIVRVFDFDVKEHIPFLVMDYLPNGSIRRSYPKGTRVPIETIVSYIKQVASALQYAHNEKLIHRDIKPENMLLDKDDIVMLSDFGIALIAQSSRYQSTQEVAGTAAYMAPEQFQGKPRRASDQYALGIVVYEWLTGDRPFHGSFTEIASQHLFVPPPPLHEKDPTISLEVEQVVLTALEKDPQKRFVSVQAFAAALEQACEPAPTHPVILPPDRPLPRRPSLPSDGIILLSSSQSPFPTNMVTPRNQSAPASERITPPGQSLPRNISTTPFHIPDELASSSGDSLRSDKSRPLSPTPSPLKVPSRPMIPSAPNVLVHRNNIAVVNRHQDTSSRGKNASRFSLSRGKTILLIGLVFLLLIASGSGLFYFIHINQITAITNANVTPTAIANPYGGRLALYDPLRDDSLGNRWGGESGYWGNCAFADGAFHVSKAANRGGNYCSAPSTDFSNFAFEVQMKIIKGDLGGLVFRLDYNNNNFYFFSLSIDGHFGLSLCPNGYCKNLVPATFSSVIHQGMNQTNIVAVVAKGSTFTLYVNRQQLTNANDNTYSHGQIALAAWQPPTSDLTEVVYNNVKVWTI